MTKKNAFGKGLGALLSNIESEVNTNQPNVVAELSRGVAMIPIKFIEPNPFNPRTDFEETALQELAESIAVHGVIQPVTVRRLSENQYQIISGERRWRASQKAGLDELPAYVRIANDQELLEMALVENIQREDLNAIEVAVTYKRLMEECALTQEQLSERVAKKRSTVTNYIRLLKLPPEVQNSIKNNVITMGHARAIVGVDDIATQLAVFKTTVDQGLSVRATEELIKKYGNAVEKPKAQPSSLPRAYESVQSNLRDTLGAKVGLTLGKEGSGKITIDFSSTDDLNRILDIINN